MNSARLCLTIGLLWLSASLEARAEGGVVAGYRHIETNRLKVRHDTHPDDGLLSNAGQPGSAGTTDLKSTEWLYLGGRLAAVKRNRAFSVDLGLLASPTDSNQDHRQNANDFRPPAEGSFIYSESKYGIGAGVALTYDFRRLIVGGEGQLSAIYVESGWDRFGRDELEKKSLIPLWAVGPKIGWIVGDRGAVEASFLFGNATVVTLSFSALF